MKDKSDYIDKLFNRRIELLKLLFNGKNTDKKSMEKHIENNKLETRKQLSSL